MSLKDKVVGVLPPNPIQRQMNPLWGGPEKDGVTSSLLSRYLVCRERFRLKVMEGLHPTETFNHRIEYGSMWHVCEEALAALSPPDSRGRSDGKAVSWEKALLTYCQGLVKRYPTQTEQIDKWYQICKTQFPIYVDYWRAHPDVRNRVPLFQEKVFDVAYDLPSGRTVRLRGKWDAVDVINYVPPCTCGADRTGPTAEAHDRKCPAAKSHTVTGEMGIYLQENKSKGEIDGPRIVRQLGFDLQTMVYVVALVSYRGEDGLPEYGPVAGVRYNVIRRPLSGKGVGGSIKPKKPTKSNPAGESKAAFYARLGGIIKDSPADFFARWKVDLTPGDIEKFRRETLDPVLENLTDDYEWWAYVYDQRNARPSLTVYDGQDRARLFPQHSPRHYRHPFGVYNVLDEGGSSDLDEYLATGSTTGLAQATTLFPELDE